MRPGRRRSRYGLSGTLRGADVIKTPYLLFLGDAADLLAAKVAVGVRDWRPELAFGQMRLPGCAVDLGLEEMDPAQAHAAGARTLLIGVANRGGVIGASWKPALLQALEAGLDLASGLHGLLRDDPDLAQAAADRGRALHDVRVPPEPYPVASGAPRSGRRCVFVGTDCSVGKMYTAMALEREMRARGMKATFRATGQTGILVAGAGVPLDAVVADFMAGAVERLTPPNDDDHWDLVEGQGSLFHVSYSGVTMALIHGAQPTALILCDDPAREGMRGLDGHVRPTLAQLRDLAVPTARIANPACTAVGASLNTSGMDEPAARACIAGAEEALGLPATDPVRFGAGILADALAAV